MKIIQSPYQIEVFDSKKDWIKFFALILAMFLISIAFEYRNYKAFLNTKTIEAQVLLQYKKPDKNYFILKLKSLKGEVVYTTSRDDLQDLRGRFVSVYGKASSDCSFDRYLQSCFFIGFSISLLSKRDYLEGVKDYISNQHDAIYTDKFDEFEANLFAQMYNALIFATPMPKTLRDSANIFGIAHIFAISGFHLSILALVFYGILSLPYRALQRRFFTYRNEFYDLNFIVLIFAFLYLIILQFSPSFLRSFVMFAFGIFVLYRGLKLLSFKLLFAAVLFILALFPKIFFSIGFWLSVSGIFYIYLCLKHIKIANKFLYAVILNILVSLNMLPIAHFFFFVFSPYVALSPFITMAFVVFYPLSLGLHIVGFGGIFDRILSLVVNHQFFYIELKTSLIFLCGFLALSLLAIRQKVAYYAVNAISLLFFFVGIYKFIKGFYENF